MPFREGFSLRGTGGSEAGTPPEVRQGQPVKVPGGALNPRVQSQPVVCLGPEADGFCAHTRPCTAPPHTPPMWGVKLAEDGPRPGAHGTGPRAPRTHGLPGGCQLCLVWSILFLVRTGLSGRKWAESCWVHV